MFKTKALPPAGTRSGRTIAEKMNEAKNFSDAPAPPVPMSTDNVNSKALVQKTAPIPSPPLCATNLRDSK